MVIKIILLFIGIITGWKNRQKIIYILYFLLPFYDLGTLKIINISLSNIIKYLCIIPITITLLIDLLNRRRKQNKNFIHIFILVSTLLAYIMTRYPVSYHPIKNLMITWLGAAFVVFLYVLYNFNNIDYRKITSIIKVMILIQTTIALLQIKGIHIYQIFPFININTFNHRIIKLADYYRATGSFVDPNYFALYMGILNASLIHYCNKKNIRIFFTLGLIGLILSFSRMGILMAAILIISYFIHNSTIKSHLTIFKYCIFLTIIVNVMFYIFNHYDFSQNLIISNIIDRFNQTKYSATHGRIFLLKSYINNIASPRNVIFGLGFENFIFEVGKKTGIYLLPHNQYIAILADIGIVGYVPIVALVAFIYNKSKSYGIYVKNPFLYPVIIILIGNLFLNTSYSMYTYFYYALACGYIVNNDNWNHSKSIP